MMRGIERRVVGQDADVSEQGEVEGCSVCRCLHLADFINWPYCTVFQSVNAD